MTLPSPTSALPQGEDEAVTPSLHPSHLDPEQRQGKGESKTTCPRRPAHPIRRVAAGSTLTARRAGRQQASKATADRHKAAKP